MTRSLAALLLAGTAAAQCPPGIKVKTATLVHATDLHARFQPDATGVSPWARVRGYYEKVARESPGAVFLSGGDEHEKGSVAEPASAGAAVREATRSMRFHARVLGNHDFAWGSEALLDHARDPRGVTLASNLHWSGADRLAFAATDYAELEVNGLRVGFIGLVTMPWNEKDQPDPAPYPGFRCDWDYASVATRLARSKARGADFLVLLSHLGREDDLKVAAKVPELGLILGGHTHGWTWSAEKVGPVLVVESGHDAMFLSRVDLDFDPKTRKVCAVRHDLHKVGPGTPASPRVSQDIARILERWAPAARRPSGCAARDADKASLAALAARAGRQAHGADAALVDLKTAWTPWKKGPLTPQDFLDAFKVERQPPGTPGFNSFYSAAIAPMAWNALLARLDRSRWAVEAPPPGTPVRRIVLPKRAALHARESLGVELGDLRPAGEVWEALDALARRRAAARRCVDE
jgi:5'-nucleotidase / UDP-sugar diphosphatase